LARPILLNSPGKHFGAFRADRPHRPIWACEVDLAVVSLPICPW